MNLNYRSESNKMYKNLNITNKNIKHKSSNRNKLNK